MKFRLLAGSHIAKVGEDSQGVAITKKWSQGDVIETDIDLVARYDRHDPFFPAKFQRLPDDWVEPPKEERTSPEALTPEEVAVFRAQQRQAAQQPQPATLSAATAVLTPPATMRTFEAMTAEELVKWAAEEEVDLKGAKTKDAILKVLRQNHK